jgi:hypothetical protein
MKSEKWIAVLIALIIAGFIADKQGDGGFTSPPVPATTVVGR